MGLSASKPKSPRGTSRVTAPNTPVSPTGQVTAQTEKSPPAYSTNPVEQRLPTVLTGKQIVELITNAQSGSTNYIAKQWSELYRENISDSSKPSIRGSEKDRYPGNSFVYEHSRVKLPQDHYINANFILDKTYIATQAPLDDTMADFWCMIWHQKISVIVMLTRLEENHKIKADRYWPTKGMPELEFTATNNQDFVVRRVKKQFYEDYICRKFVIRDVGSNQERSVMQVQYTGWPDHGRPADVLSFVNLLIAVERKSHKARNSHLSDGNHQNHSSEIPLLTHCSAGVGRTGTFITIRHEMIRAIEEFCRTHVDILSWNDERSFARMSLEEQTKMLREFLENHQFSIPDTIRALRTDRKTMVQAEEQHFFCFLVVCAILSPTEEGDTLLQGLLSLVFRHAKPDEHATNQG